MNTKIRFLAIFIILAFIMGSCGPKSLKATPVPQAPVVQTVEVTREVEVVKEKLDDTPRIAVISAFEGENELVLKELKEERVISIPLGNGKIDFHLGELRGKKVVVFVTVPSMINASSLTTFALLKFNISAIIFTGISGGVSPDLHIGDVAVPSSWIEYQENYKCQEVSPGKFACPSWFTPLYQNFGMDQVAPASLPGGEEIYWFDVDPALFAAAEKVNVTLSSCDSKGVCLKNSPRLVVGGKGGSSQTFLDNAEYRQYLHDALGLELIEMEGAAVAHVAYLLHTPFIIIRANSDLAGGGNPEDKLPDGGNPIAVFGAIAAGNAAQVTMGVLEQYNPDIKGNLKPITFGLLMVGPYNDHGWSQAHYEAGLYVEKKLPGAKMIYVDKVNPADRPGTTPAQLAEELVSKGAQVIVFNSDDMKDSSTEFAKSHPDIPVIMASGDQVWRDGKTYVELPSMINIMGRMEYGKMIAGCAAALTTKSGKIGYLGPLINDETRRLASSAYLGAKYCWTKYLGKDAKDLGFKVTWIGFWFNIPGVTSDPTQVADEFYNSGYDVVISGIDTTEALAEAKKMASGGKVVWAIPYDYVGACAEGQEVCLGVPYFNWGPAYLTTIKSAEDGTWKSNFQWNLPDWKNINNPDTSAVGFVKGAALSSDVSTTLDKFIAELAGGLNLWTGPLNLQDGIPYMQDGEVATDQQIWYLPQLLEGIEGQSVAK